MLSNGNILLVDDEKIISDALKKHFITNFKNLNLKTVYNGNDAMLLLQKEEFDIIIIDFKLPDISGLELFEKIKNKKICPNTNFILVSGYGNSEIGMEAINIGFYDYISKPFNFNDLLFRIERAFNDIVHKGQLKSISDSYKIGFQNIIGESPKIKNIFKIINLISNEDIAVLIEGETGTGKELIARAIFETSRRKNHIFFPINCGSISDTILESELFGYEKGAFTGASTKKFGILEMADNGTIFLDEINSASLNFQIKLLRFIETGEFMRLGSGKLLKSNTRIITATNENIIKSIREGRFREDLYHRLNVVNITLPPLRERKEDIPLLIDFFLENYNKKYNKKIKISKSAFNYLNKYSWPGNVRELQNIIQSAILLNESGIIKPENLPAYVKKGNFVFIKKISFKKQKEEIIANFEKGYFSELLKETKGNISKAATIAKLNRRNLSEKLKLYNINPADYKNK